MRAALSHQHSDPDQDLGPLHWAEREARQLHEANETEHGFLGFSHFLGRLADVQPCDLDLHNMSARRALAEALRQAIPALDALAKETQA